MGICQQRGLADGDAIGAGDHDCSLPGRQKRCFGCRRSSACRGTAITPSLSSTAEVQAPAVTGSARQERQSALGANGAAAIMRCRS
jgi:hypothetical protein